ncbi:hypothetical protein ACFP9V_21500 [Deinococcus radiopugnans]|uniref:hypothetical protein n=1 Tax=Deinococcus radiopugnans TaxID=57497 RepID=UPI00361B2A49
MANPTQRASVTLTVTLKAEWTRVAGLSSLAYDQVLDMTTDAQNNVYLVGVTQGSLEGTPQENSTRFWPRLMRRRAAVGAATGGQQRQL